MSATDQSGDAFEQLHVVSELATQESGLRDRVGRLVNFRHAKYVRLRGIDRLRTGPKDLVISYDAVEGHRLSTILEQIPKLPITLEVDLVVQIVRDLLPAIGILHDSRKVTHGAIAPERLVFTPQHRLLIVDHGFGLALSRLNLPRKKLWEQYRIAVPSSTRSVFDDRTDVVQIGLVALALLLGRPLTDEEYPGQLKRLMFSVKEASSRHGRRPIGQDLRRWLERALPIDEEQPFTTVRDAQEALEAVVATGRYTPNAGLLKAFLTRYAELKPAAPAAADPDPVRMGGTSPAKVDRALEDLAVTIAPLSPRARSRPAAPEAAAPPAAAPPAAPGARKPAGGGSPAAADGGRRRGPQLDALAALEQELSRLAGADVTLPGVDADLPGAEQEAPVAGAGQAAPPPVAPVEVSALEEAAAYSYEDAQAVIATRHPAPASSETGDPQARGQAEREAREAREAAERAAREAGARERAEREARELAERAAREAAERTAREMTERAAAEQAAREAAAREATEREAREAAERQAREAAERAAREATEREAAERAARQAAERAAAEREARERAEREARQAAERAAREMAERAAAEKAAREAAERAKREAEERMAAEAAAREAAERQAREAAERAAREREAAQKAAREAAERAAREAEERVAAESAAREAAERQAREAAERAARELAEREAAAKAAREAAERAVREAEERLAAEAAARQAAERQAREAAERAAREAAERAAAEQAAREAEERAAREVAEREAAQKAARKAAERAELEAREREAAHKAAREAAEKAAREAVEREVAERAALEAAGRAARQAAEREAAERAARERSVHEAAERDAAERATREATEREQTERQAREAALREARAAQERAAREAGERAAAERAAREAEAHAQAERAARTAAERDAQRAAAQAARDADERATAERLAREAAAQAATEREARKAAQRTAREATANAAAEREALAAARREAHEAVEGVARIAAERAAAERAARDAAARAGADPQSRAAEDEATPAADTASGPRGADGIDFEAFGRAAAVFPAPEPEPEPAVEAAAAPSPDANVHAWTPALVIEAMPAWARGSSDSAQEPSAPPAASAPVSFVAPPVFAAPAGLERYESGTRALDQTAGVLPFPGASQPNEGGAASGADVRPFRSREIPSRPVRFRVNWARTLAASLLVALLEGVAFAAAWWFVTPKEEGWLVVHTRPTGIEAMVDGRVIGRTPFATALPPGRHTIELRQGSASRVVPVEISAGVQTEQRIAWGTSFRTGQAKISTTPEGARVLIDGRAYGKTPLTVSELPAGRHEVTVEAETGSATMTLIIEPGETTELDVPVYSGWVSILAPVELEILENGRLLGTTQAEKLMLSSGRHQLVLRNESLGYSATHEVRVRPGATTAVSVLPKAPVAVEAPAGTELLVDGDSRGVLPIEKLEVSIGTREFVLRPPDGQERRQVVLVTLNAPVVVRY